MTVQEYFTKITASALPHKGHQKTVNSLLAILPDVIALVDPHAEASPMSVADRETLAAQLKGLLATMKERKLDVTLEDWELEAHGCKKDKRIVNFKRTNESPQGLHSVFILPVYAGPDGKLCTTVQHQLRPHPGTRAQLEIPAGKFDESDISTESTAARELQEETGLVWDYDNEPAIARGGRHDGDGGLTNAKGETLVVPVDFASRLSSAFSNDEKAQGLGQIHSFPIELIPEYIDHCLEQGLGVMGTLSNIALGMRLQRYLADHETSPIDPQKTKVD